MKFNVTNQKAPATLMRQGVLYFQGKPLYIIETPEDDVGMVVVYGVADVEDGKEPIKDFNIVQTDESIRGGTVLSDALKAVLPKKKGKKVRQTKPPIFTAPIVPGIDTVTGKEGLGFFERQPSVYEYATQTYKEGEPTLVFITLDSIEWVKTFLTPDTVLKQYTQNKESSFWL